MNFVFISPNFPQNFQEFSVSLAKKGITTLGIGSEAYDELGDKVRNSLREYYRVSDLHNTDEVKRAVAFFFHKYGTIDRIESHKEYWLDLDVALRTQFNVEGQELEILEMIRNRAELKKVFVKAKIPVLDGYLVQSKSDIKKAIKALKFPIIARPNIKVEAGAIYRLETKEDVKVFEEQVDLEIDYLLETALEGKMISFDGFVDQDGDIVFESSVERYVDDFELFSKSADSAYFVNKKVESRLKKYAKKIIKKFKTTENFFHLEFLKLEDGSYIALDYSNTFPNAYTIDMYNYAYSRSLFDDYADMISYEEIEEKEENDKYCLAITRRHGIAYSLSEVQLYERYGANILICLENPMPTKELQGDVTYMILSDSPELRLQIAKDFASRQ